MRGLAFAVVFAVVPGVARAGGIFVPGTGPQAQARAGAFAAKADDPTAIANNPAGLAKLDGTVLFVGGNFVRSDVSYTRDGFYEPTGDDLDYEGLPYPTVENEASPSPGFAGFQMIPYIAVSTDLGRPDWPVRIGAGVYTPQGSTAREFPQFHDLPGATTPAPGPQRYDVFVQKGAAALPSVAASYSPLDQLDIGVRVSWPFATIETRKVVWAIRNYDEYNEKDSIVDLEASDPFLHTSIGPVDLPVFGLGVLYRPAPWLELGAAYASSMKIRAKGTLNSVPGAEVPDEGTIVPIEDEFARCERGGRPGAIKACIQLDIPQYATVGARWILRGPDGGERADVELDLTWEDWSAGSDTLTFSDGLSTGIPLNDALIRHGFQDVLSVRLGGAYRVVDGPTGVTARGGVAFDTRTAPLSFTRLDTDGKERLTMTAGAAVRVSRFQIDVGGGYVWEPDRTVPNDCQPPSGPTIDSPGCLGNGEETPYFDRTRPDPAQPKRDPGNQIENPFNAGLYESSYLLLHLGVTTWF